MRILVANPHLVRLNAFGACEQDRLKNVQTLKHLGHEVRAFTFSTPARPIEAVTQVYVDRGLPVTVVSITHARLEPARLTDIAYLDGAAWQYAQSSYLSALEKTLAEFKPDLIWCHGSYHWAPARLARSHGLRAVIRSVNYEPEQLRHEHDFSLANTIRYFGKVQSERRALQSASVMAAITPDELAIYQRIDPGACVQLLPLATLPELLREPTVRDRHPLHICFMGATYNVPHNRRALDFVTLELMPILRRQAPGDFVLHVFGSKVPDSSRSLQSDDLIFEGYVSDLESRLADMDIAVSPSLAGVGMQQKIFEPLCRGIPTVTHRRGLAGYHYRDGESVLLSETAEDFARCLLELRSLDFRRRIAGNAAAQSAALFAQDAMHSRVQTILECAVQS